MSELELRNHLRLVTGLPELTETKKEQNTMEFKKTEMIEAKIYECDDVEGDYLRVEYNLGSPYVNFNTSADISLESYQIKDLVYFLQDLLAKEGMK